MSQNEQSRNPRKQDIEVPDSEPRRRLPHRGALSTPERPSSSPASSSAASKEIFSSPELPLNSNQRRQNSRHSSGLANEPPAFPSPELPLSSNQRRQNNPRTDQSDNEDPTEWQNDLNTFPIAIKHTTFDTFLLVNSRWSMQRLHQEILQVSQQEFPVFAHSTVKDLKVHFEMVPQ
ncbi:MAG: hypothetical protein Q9208_006880, partial [Pyrenodesmia sp. 3 TL-2023]